MLPLSIAEAATYVISKVTTNVALTLQRQHIMSQRLEPLSTLLKLSLLAFHPIGTKLCFSGNQIYIQQPTAMQPIMRYIYRTSREDLHILQDVLQEVCRRFPPQDDRMRLIYTLAIEGLRRLKHSYAEDQLSPSSLLRFPLSSSPATVAALVAPSPPPLQSTASATRSCSVVQTSIDFYISILNGSLSACRSSAGSGGDGDQLSVLSTTMTTTLTVSAEDADQADDDSYAFKSLWPQADIDIMISLFKRAQEHNLQHPTKESLLSLNKTVEAIENILDAKQIEVDRILEPLDD